MADNNRNTFTTGNEIHGINVETKMIIKLVIGIHICVAFGNMALA
jgi:hypothetical protein